MLLRVKSGLLVRPEKSALYLEQQFLDTRSANYAASWLFCYPIAVIVEENIAHLHQQNNRPMPLTLITD
jgi:hypothetical protein